MTNNELNQHEILTKEEEIQLGRTVKNSNVNSKEYIEAFQTLINRNLKLVAKEAYKFSKKTGQNVDDLIGEGRVGLITAIQKYDPDSYTGSRFATYAQWWIQQKIRMYIMQFQTAVHIPNYLSARLVKFRKIINDNPCKSITDEEIMKEIDVDEKQLEALKYANVQSISMQHSTPNKSQKFQKENTIEDSLFDHNTVAPDIDIMNKEISNNLYDAIKNLSEMEQDIITSIYFNEDKVILKDLGDKYGLSSERIRQIKVDSLKKLKETMSEKDIGLENIEQMKFY